jgi:hypothetical protein
VVNFEINRETAHNLFSSTVLHLTHTRFFLCFQVSVLDIAAKPRVYKVRNINSMNGRTY